MRHRCRLERVFSRYQGSENLSRGAPKLSQAFAATPKTLTLSARRATGADATTMPRARSSLKAILRGGIVLGAIVGMMQADAVFAYVQTGGVGTGQVAVAHTPLRVNQNTDMQPVGPGQAPRPSAAPSTTATRVPSTSAPSARRSPP